MDRGALKVLVAGLATLLFGGLYLVALIQVLTAAPGTPPSFGDNYIAAITALTGGLASAFAIAIGVKGQAERTWAFPPISLKDVYMVALAVYAVLSTLGLGTALLKPDETPQWFASLALIFVGYLAGLLAKAADVI